MIALVHYNSTLPELAVRWHSFLKEIYFEWEDYARARQCAHDQFTHGYAEDKETEPFLCVYKIDNSFFNANKKVQLLRERLFWN